MQLFGLIGYPLSHSFSKGYFSEKFQKENIDGCRYDNYPIEDISLLPGVIESNPQLIGLNVTIPYKEKVLTFLDNISDEAKEIGAVNTIRIHRQHKRITLSGYNTDVYGFSESLKPLLKPHHTSALILGTGGASKAVKFALNKLGIDFVQVSRNRSEECLGYEDVTEDIIETHKIIVNTTPLGTFPKIEEYPSLPYQFLNPQHLLYDLVYNPGITAFLNHGLNHGCRIKNGLEMLHLQAEKSWEIWNGL
jgi:shikimate dehydrogenase